LGQQTRVETGLVGGNAGSTEPLASVGDVLMNAETGLLMQRSHL
jgi:hypothetical protein